MRASLIPKAGVLLAATLSPARAAPLTASEINAEIVGRELCTPKSGGLFADLIFCFTYRRDGTFQLKPDNPSEPVGWVLDEDRLCLFKLKAPKDRSCATFERAAEHRFRVNGKDIVCVGPCAD
jgi:hypothetical protein